MQCLGFFFRKWKRDSQWVRGLFGKTVLSQYQSINIARTVEGIMHSGWKYNVDCYGVFVLSRRLPKNFPGDLRKILLLCVLD